MFALSRSLGARLGARLGVSNHSLYKWVKEVVPSKDEKQDAELIEAKGEILRLRAQMRRREEERDLLKKGRGGFNRSLQRFCEFIAWRHKCKRLARSCIEFVCNDIQLFLCEGR